MIAMARAQGVNVFIGTIPPIGDGTPKLAMVADSNKRNAQISAINAWIKSLQGVEVIDYNAALSSPDGHYFPALTIDGMHPSLAGYTVLTKMAESRLGVSSNWVDRIRDWGLLDRLHLIGACLRLEKMEMSLGMR
jgi:lysophospholipase L1-like esterase